MLYPYAESWEIIELLSRKLKRELEFVEWLGGRVLMKKVYDIT